MSIETEPVKHRGEAAVVATGTSLPSRLAAGDEAAVEELHSRFGSTVFGYLCQVLHDRGAAEDVFQVVMTEAWKRRKQYDASRSGLTTWLLTIARSRAIDEMRRRKPEPVDPVDVPDVMQSSAEDALLEQWRIRQLLDHLPEDERVLLELRFFEDCSQSEIAERTGIALGTIKARMVRGLERLRTLVDAEGAWT
jgi:RNA polymerase sigma-70 factor (ECF subfamily)